MIEPMVAIAKAVLESQGPRAVYADFAIVPDDNPFGGSSNAPTASDGTRATACPTYGIESGAQAAVHRMSNMTLLGDVARAESHLDAERRALAAQEATTMVSGEALSKAAWDGDVARVQQLLLDGADVEWRQGGASATPVMAAAFQGHQNIVELLAEAGADTAVRSDNGKSARDWALENKQAETIALLDDWEKRSPAERAAEKAAKATAAAAEKVVAERVAAERADL